jgi:hypothetical protein
MNSTSKPYRVGDGLKRRTYEECLQYGLNPNPNHPGSINLPTDPAVMREHVRGEKAKSLRLLRAR